MNLKTVVLGPVVLAMSAIAMPALAHHSYAEFDTAKKVTLEGTVKEYQWTNPHGWMLVMVPNAKGVPEQWAFELGSVSGIARAGWTPKTVVPGDKVAVTFRPMKNGSHAGQYLSIKLPSGKVMGGGADQAGG